MIEADVVLDLAAVADRSMGTDHHVLAQRAPPADRNPRQYVAEVPDDGTLADAHRIVDIGALVNADPRKTGVVTPLI
jgi:hypothetical protein